MERYTRRRFMNGAAACAAALASDTPAGSAQTAAGRDATTDMPLGIITHVADPVRDIARVRDLGFTTCQLAVSDYSMEMAIKVRDNLVINNLSPTCLICMGPGAYVWNFREGPRTIGLVPREMRAERVARLREGTDFCRQAGIPAVLAHFGFIPEDPNDVLYGEFIDVMKDVAGYARERGVGVRFETGQETPVTLLRAFADIGAENLEINYDTANLIMYGKANPVDGLEVVGHLVASLHAKDGMYPMNPDELGRETPIGEGWVDFPAVIRKLKAMNFRGHITIEREISGPRQIDDIKRSKDYLEDLIKTA